MSTSILRNYLLPIMRRQQELRRQRGLAAIFFVGALIGLGLYGLQQVFGEFSFLPLALWTLSVLGCAAWYERHQQQASLDQDFAATVARIETAHPDLNALLKTAVEQTGADGQTSLNYLQDRLIKEAVDHAVSNQWIQLVPQQAMQRGARWTMIGKLACALVFVVLALPLARSNRVEPLAQIEPTNSGPRYAIEVTPGNIEVERGDRLVVLARFSELVPGACELVLQSSGAATNHTRSIEMKKNLDDPVFGGIIPEVNEDLTYYVRTSGEESPRYAITTFTYPALIRCDLTISPPSYIQEAVKHTADTLYANVWAQSEVTIELTLNKAVKTATLVDEQEQGYLLEAMADKPNRYQLALTPDKSNRYTLHLLDDQGRTNRKTPELVIDVRINQPPKLKFLFPRQDATVSAIQELPLRGEVSDDLGILQYGMAYTISGQPKEVRFEQSGPVTKQSAEHLLALEQHALEPNDLLSYYLWAEDLGPNGKPRRVSSDMYFAEVRHFEEIFREKQSPPSESESEPKPQAEKLLKLQKQVIQATWNVQRQDEPNTDDLAVIKESQAQAQAMAEESREKVNDEQTLEHLNDAIAHMELSVGHLSDAVAYDDARKIGFALTSEQAAYQSLIKMRGREYEIMKSQSKSKGQAQQQSERPDIQNLKLKQQERQYETEKQAKAEQEKAKQEQRENLQVLNRLRELARRQNEIKEKMQELQHALEAAQSEAEKAEIRRQLKRLGEEQQDLLRDVDELNQRMNEEQNRERMIEQRKQLEDTRKDVQKTAEQMEKEDLSSAANTASRAERKLEELKQEIRKQSAGQFNEAMRDMRDQARELNEQQEKIDEQIGEAKTAKQKPREQKRLSDEDVPETDAQAQLRDQQQRVSELLKQAAEVSEQAEHAEPLLSSKLYDTVRDANGNRIEDELSRTADYLRFGRETEAKEANQQASAGLEELKQGIEQAAESVLGNEAEALKRAKRELSKLIEDLDQEMKQATPSNAQQNAKGSPTTPAEKASEKAASQPSEQTGKPGETPGEQPGEQAGKPGEKPGDQPSQQAGKEPGKQPGKPSPQQGGQPQPGGQGSPNGARVSDFTQGPLTGTDYRGWSDRLRDVEEGLDQPALREQTARIRDRAKAMRAEFKRHSEAPSWELVQSQVLDPLVELQKQVNEALIQLDAGEKIVPIDRDAVPARFEELNRRYYDKLGEGD